MPAPAGTLSGEKGGRRAVTRVPARSHPVQVRPVAPYFVVLRWKCGSKLSTTDFDTLEAALMFARSRSSDLDAYVHGGATFKEQFTPIEVIRG